MRTGDVVKHIPSGETWVVAWADRTDVIACGWPETIAYVYQCQLVTAATDEEHVKLVKEIAASHSNGFRGARCRALLESWLQEECAEMMHL